MKKLVVVVAACVALTLCLAGCSDAAAEIDERIANIGEVTVDSMETLELIEADYQALSDEDKARVEGYDILASAMEECALRTVDANFLAALEESVTKRMADADSDDFTSLVNTELAYLEQYREAGFFDPIVADAASNYLLGLDKQKEALGKTEMYYEYQQLWNEGLVLRCGALKSLHDEFGFMAGNTEFVADYVMAYEDRKAWYDAFLAIEADIGAQDEAGEIEYGGSIDDCEITVTLMNNTDYSFESVWEFDFLAEDGTVLESSEGYATALPNAKYVVTAYASYDTMVNFDSYHWVNWYSEIYA